MQSAAESFSVKLVFQDRAEGEVKSLAASHQGSLLRPRSLDNSAAPPGFPTGAEILIGFKIATAVFTSATAALAFYKEVQSTLGENGKASMPEAMPSSEQNAEEKPPSEKSPPR